MKHAAHIETIATADLVPYARNARTHSPEQIAQIVMQEFQVPWLRLRLSKPGAVRGSQDVGLIIERGSKS